MQCPVCGRDTETLIEGSCADCAAKKHTTLAVPPVLELLTCAHCGSVQQGNRWVPGSKDVEVLVRKRLEDSIEHDPALRERRVTLELRWQDERIARAQVHLAAHFQGVPIEQSTDVEVRVKRSSCTECSRSFGGYFEAVLQVRGADPDVYKRLEGMLLEIVDKELNSYKGEHRTGAFVSKAETVRGGHDFYVGGLEVARLLAQTLVKRTGAEYQESTSLVGRRQGQDLYRFTLLVRLPPYLAGDFIQMDERLYKVLSHSGKLLTLWDFENKIRVQREPKRAKSLRVVGRAHDVKDAVVVSKHGNDLQIMDPETYQTIDLKTDKPVREGETVRVFRFEDELILVPADGEA